MWVFSNTSNWQSEPIVYTFSDGLKVQFKAADKIVVKFTQFDVISVVFILNIILNMCTRVGIALVGCHGIVGRDKR